MEKVLFILEDINRSGSPQTALHFIKALPKEFKVDLLVTCSKNKENDLFRLNEFEPHCDKIITLDLPHFTRKRFALLYHKYLNKIKAEIRKLFNNNEYKYVYINRKKIAGDIASFIKNNYSSKVVFNSLGNLYDERKSRFAVLRKRAKRQKERIIKYSDWLIAISKNAMYRDVDPNDNRLVYLYDYPEIPRLEGRKTFLKDGVIRMGQIGYYVPNKNQLFSLKILNEFIQCGKEATLTFVGFEIGESKSYLHSMMKYINENNLIKHVIFKEKTYDKIKFFDEIDVLLQPSYTEGAPLTVIESQYRLTPCLVSLAVPEEINFGGLTRLDLKEGAFRWAENLTRPEFFSRIIKPIDTKEQFEQKVKNIFQL